MTDENKEKKLRWYVIQAFSGFEKRVAQTIKEHIKIQGLEDSFGEVLVPTEEVVEMRAGQKRKSERKFFPGDRKRESNQEDKKPRGQSKRRKYKTKTTR